MYSDITDVFLDLDHTLWDFDKNSALTFEHIFKAKGLEIGLPDFLAVYGPINLEFWKSYRDGKMTKSTLRYRRLKDTFDRLGMDVDDAIIHGLADEYIAHLSTFPHLLPGALDALEYMGSRYKLHIVTNGFTEVQERKLQSSGIRHFFDQVVDAEAAGAKKPNAAIFEQALGLAGTHARNSLMIGDDLEADVQGAMAVGLQALHLNVNSAPLHEFCPIIFHWDEIKDLL